MSEPPVESKITVVAAVFWIAIPAITWLVASSGIIWALAVWSSWSLWIAIPAGVILGYLLLAFFAFANDATHNLNELNISCAILLVLLLILFPVLNKARERSKHQISRPATLSVVGRKSGGNWAGYLSSTLLC